MFDANCRYDVILGNGFINKVRIDIKGSNETVEWFGNSISNKQKKISTL